jgi:Restriction endonuclease
MSGDSLLGILGIIVSVVLFLIGYRQTVGAKKERVAAADAEIEKILVRRIVLEGYAPKTADIERLAEGKARDFRVARSDLLAAEELLNVIFTRIIESDLIPHDRRDELVKRIMPAIIEVEGEPVKERAILEIQSKTKHFITSGGTAVALGVVASMLGAVVSILPNVQVIDSAPKELIATVAATLVASLAIIMSLIFFKRVKESQEGISQSSSIERYATFERDVARSIEKLVGIVRAAPSDGGFDFMVEKAGKKILIEVKSWVRPVPRAVIARTAERLKTALDGTKADLAIIVTPSSFPSSVALDLGENIRLMALRDLRNFLAHGM